MVVDDIHKYWSKDLLKFYFVTNNELPVLFFNKELARIGK